MKLLRLKIKDPEGFRSLPCGFEHYFRTERALQDELVSLEGFAPFVCAGRNGSGKSNLLEALAAIFYHMECIYLENRPDSFDYDEKENPKGFQSKQGVPDGFEVEYLIRRPNDLPVNDDQVRVQLTKVPKEDPQWRLWNATQNDWEKLEDLEKREKLSTGRALRRSLLPDYILGYSSGENEILSLPFFKMRFVQFDEYWNHLQTQTRYPGRPETRLAYLDNGFSQAILLCNLLFQNEATLQPFREDVGIEALKEFRIILRRSIQISPKIAEQFGKDNPAVRNDPESGQYSINLVRLLEADERLQEALKAQPEQSSMKYENFDPAVTRLKRCATLSYEDEAADTLILDYCVNEETRKAFSANFTDALELFQAFQVLLTLNLYPVSDALKADLYRSDSHYVGETVPTLASDQRIMRFKNVFFTKRGVTQPILHKSLSDGEHQLLHSLGLCLLFRDTNSLFLLDEPETHFNPDWRASFITRLNTCLQGREGGSQEMLITTHSPFLISDSKPDKVLVFEKDKATGIVSISHPDYNTLGASINKISMETFQKQETIGRRANQILLDLLSDPTSQSNPLALAKRIMESVGDSIERTFAVQAVLARSEWPNSGNEPD